jgi:hypothetical protein
MGSKKPAACVQAHSMLSVNELRPPARRAHMHAVRDCASPHHAAKLLLAVAS